MWESLVNPRVLETRDRWGRANHPDQTYWAHMYQGGEIVLQANCGRFDSDWVHQYAAVTLMVNVLD